MSPRRAFECTLCCEVYEHEIPILVPDNDEGDEVCVDCFLTHIRPQFEDALRYEHAYPVRWGIHTVQPHNYKRLPKGFILKWLCKEREYQTPMAQRMYCAHRVPTDWNAYGDWPGKAVCSDRAHMLDIKTQTCGRFLGITNAGGVHICWTCGGLTCSSCGAAFFASRSARPSGHLCELTDHEQSTEDPLDGLVAGKDYQTCVKHFEIPNEGLLTCEDVRP